MTIRSTSWYLRIQRRSIQSFHRQTQAPCALNGPREATAKRSPIEMSARCRRCGCHGLSGSPRTCLRKFSASGAPARTANTPAFSRGVSTKAAQSPAAKTSGSFNVWKVGPVARKPPVSSARAVSRNQRGPVASVVTSAASISIAGPSSNSTVPGVSPRTGRCSYSFTPRCAKARRKASPNSTIMSFEDLAGRDHYKRKFCCAGTPCCCNFSKQSRPNRQQKLDTASSAADDCDPPRSVGQFAARQ